MDFATRENRGMNMTEVLHCIATVVSLCIIAAVAALIVCEVSSNWADIVRALGGAGR